MMVKAQTRIIHVLFSNLHVVLWLNVKKILYVLSNTFERQLKSNATLLTSQVRVQKRESRKKFQHTQEWKATSKDGILKPARSRECSLGASRGKYRQQALKRTN